MNLALPNVKYIDSIQQEGENTAIKVDLLQTTDAQGSVENIVRVAVQSPLGSPDSVIRMFHVCETERQAEGLFGMMRAILRVGGEIRATARPV